jgi:hypothetical protein
MTLSIFSDPLTVPALSLAGKSATHEADKYPPAVAIFLQVQIGMSRDSPKSDCPAGIVAQDAGMMPA